MGKPRAHTFLFLLLISLTFSPLVIPERTMTPWLLGMPRTLWMGILLSLALLLLTLVTALRMNREEQPKTKD